MKRLVFSLVIGTAALYLSIRWFPTEQPINFSYYFASLIFNPIRFFAASIAFMFAFLFLSYVFQTIIIELAALLNRNRKFSIARLFIALFIVLVPYFLSAYSIWILTINLIVAFIYGIFTLELNKGRTLDKGN
jgi:hypothetical protein